MEEHMEDFGEKMENTMEALGEMSPEEAGKAMGEFMQRR
jgi:hypothetical protein